jgi:hypothetical protein
LSVIVVGVWYETQKVNFQPNQISFNGKETPKEGPTASTTEPIKDETSGIDTSNWNVYRNEKYGYEIKYPNNYQIDQTDLGNVFMGANSEYRATGVFVRVLNNKLEEEIRSLKSRDSLTTVLEEKEIYLGGVKAFKLVLTNAIGVDDLFYFLRKNDISYKLRGVNSDIHNKIISTFNFIEGQ